MGRGGRCAVCLAALLGLFSLSFSLGSGDPLPTQVYSFLCNMATRTFKEVDRHRPFRRAAAITAITFVPAPNANAGGATAATAPPEAMLIVACVRGFVRLYGLKPSYFKLLPRTVLQARGQRGQADLGGIGDQARIHPL